MRAFITGATGFVGFHLTKHLLECGDTVLGTTLDSPSQISDCQLIKLDILDASSVGTVISSFKPDVIYHLAGQAFVPDAENDFLQTLKINVAGTSVIARTAHLVNSGIRLVFVSSAEVYGKIIPEELPISETCSIKPQNNYSLSKAMAELVVERYARQGQMCSVIARSFNHIGPGQSSKFVAASFAQQLALIAKGMTEAKIRVGNLEARRDFTDVRDIVRAYRLCGEKGSGIYNFGSGRAIKIRELLDTLIEVSGVRVTIEQDPSRMRASEVPEVYADISKARTELSWEPKVDLRTTLKDVFNYWIERT